MRKSNQVNEATETPVVEADRSRTGVAGLDSILRGGLPANRLYVVEGEPGSGKTTLAMQFLLEGISRGETALYVTLSETADELTQVAESHGWSLKGMHLLELGALGERLADGSDYTVFHPADVELQETVKRVQAEVERLKPQRVVLDSVSELKILAETNARYRREILGMKQFFVGRGCTVLILDDRVNRDNEQQQQLQSIAHGVIRMNRDRREYGDTRRQVLIVKMRGVRFHDGLHDCMIRTGGLEVYPRLEVGGKQLPDRNNAVMSGVPELDVLLGGGLDHGTSTLVIGPAGCGKTTLCSQYAIAALARGEHVTCFLFEESRRTFLDRASGMGMDFEPYLKSGQVELNQVDPSSFSPGEFAHRVCRSVEQKHASLVLIDSLNGYLNAMPSERSLVIQMHELLSYLGQKGVLTMLVMAQHGMLGPSMQTPIDVSFLADTVVLLRFFEASGEVRQAISVVKKRRTAHERTIREMRLTSKGVVVGEPLREFQGVLTGVPRYRGTETPLLKKDGPN
jgi:circadian clock protein KaiC